MYSSYSFFIQESKVCVFITNVTKYKKYIKDNHLHIIDSYLYKITYYFLLYILIILIIHDTLHLHVNRSQVMVYHYSKLIVSIIDNSDWLCVRINDSKPWQRWMNFKTCLAFCCISFMMLISNQCSQRLILTRNTFDFL